MIDGNGKLLGDCYVRLKGELPAEKGANSGCPAKEEEVNAFIDVLRKTTRLTEAELRIIHKLFRQNEVVRN